MDFDGQSNGTRTGANPDHIYAYGADVVQLRHDAFEVTNAVAIAVFETGGVDLVYDRIFPPWSLNDSHLVWYLCFVV